MFYTCTPLQKELKMRKKKLIFKKECVSPKRTRKHQTLSTPNNLKIKRSFNLLSCSERTKKINKNLVHFGHILQKKLSQFSQFLSFPWQNVFCYLHLKNTAKKSANAYPSRKWSFLIIQLLSSVNKNTSIKKTIISSMSKNLHF